MIRSVCAENLFSYSVVVLLCRQWQAGGSATEGAFGGGSDLAVSVLSAPHSPSGGVCHLPHRGQHHHCSSLLMLKLSLDLIHTYLDLAWFIHSVGVPGDRKSLCPSQQCVFVWPQSCFSPGGGQQCADHAGGGDHGREPAGCSHDPGEDLSGPGLGGAIPGLS